MTQFDDAEEFVARRIAHVAVGSSRYVSNEYKIVALDFIHNSDFESFKQQFGPHSHPQRDYILPDTISEHNSTSQHIEQPVEQHVDQLDQVSIESSIVEAVYTPVPQAMQAIPSVVPAMNPSPSESVKRNRRQAPRKEKIDKQSCQFGCSIATNEITQDGNTSYYCYHCYLRVLNPQQYCISTSSRSNTPCKKPKVKGTDYCIYHGPK